MGLIDDALALARRSRALGLNPFRRSMQGQPVDREALLRATLDVYLGRTGMYFEPLPGEANDNEKLGEGRSRPGRLDITRLRGWIDTLSNTYGGAPVRQWFVDGERVDEDDPVIAAVVEAYNLAEIDRVFEDVDAQMNLLGNVVLRPIFDEDVGELVVHQYRAPSVRVLDNRLNPRYPQATVLTATVARDGGRDEVHAEIWMDGQYLRLVEGEVVERASIPALPLVHCFNRLPNNLTGYWSSSIGPALAHVDRVLSNDYIGPLGYTAAMQGFSQAVIYGLDPGQAVTVGPGRVLKMSGDPDRRQGLEYVQPNAPINDLSELVEAMVRMIEQAHGIPAGLLDVDVSSSGAAIVQANAPLAEMRERRGKVFRRIETDLLRKTIGVLAGRDSRVPVGVDPDRYDVSVAYAEAQTAVSVNDRNAREKFLLDIGVLTIGDIAVQEFPDRWDSPQQANEELQGSAVKQLPTAPEVAEEKASEKSQSEPDEGQTVVPGNPYRIEERGNKFVVLKSDTGKLIGTHNTREAAEAQLQALHAADDEDEK